MRTVVRGASRVPLWRSLSVPTQMIERMLSTKIDHAKFPISTVGIGRFNRVENGIERNALLLENHLSELLCDKSSVYLIGKHQQATCKANEHQKYPHG